MAIIYSIRLVLHSTILRVKNSAFGNSTVFEGLVSLFLVRLKPIAVFQLLL